MQYGLSLRTKVIDLSAPSLVAVLHTQDALELGAHALDRIEIHDPQTGHNATAVLDTTQGEVKPGEIGLFHELRRELHITRPTKVEVALVADLDSARYIRQKIRGAVLNSEQINQIVSDINANRVSDVELAALMTTVYIRGWNLDETISMTKALLANGRTLSIHKSPVLDKHCIGGTNGRTSMVVVPIIAAAGYYIPKTSSRSITSAAGTADSMEVLAPVELDIDKTQRVVEKTGGCIVWGGSLDLAPVDDKIIRVEHPLSLDPPGQIIASVMGKKASVGAQFLVIDVPVGPDVKVTEKEKAKKLARDFIEVGKQLNIKVEVLLTDGSSPVGNSFGPALEAQNVLDVLEGNVFDDLAQKSCEIAGSLLELCGGAHKGQGFGIAKEYLASGKALEKFHEIVRAQGGKPAYAQDVPLGKNVQKVVSNESGEVDAVNIRRVTAIARAAGAPGDKGAGVRMNAEIGNRVNKGDTIYTVYAQNPQKLAAALELAHENSGVTLERLVIEKLE